MRLKPFQWPTPQSLLNALTLDFSGDLCLQSITSFAALLRLSALRGPLLEGLAASIGGLDASLAAAAASALVEALTAADSTGGGGEAGPQLLLGAADCLLDLWSRHAR